MTTADARETRVPHTVIYVGPESTAGGIGHYSDVFVEALRDQIDEVIAIRHPGPGSDSVAELTKRRREIHRRIQEPGRVVVHSEISGGSVESFWPTAFLEHAHPGLRNSVTVHDPPGLVWLPARTRLLARSRVASHALHYPTRPLIRSLERRAARDRSLFGLTRIGARSLAARYPRADVHHVPHFVLDRPVITPVAERPRAVGIFGLVYRGKGFEHIERIRAELDPSVSLRIAGRGTESLPSMPGVEVLGGLDGAELDNFFASVRALLVPYGQRTPYGDVFPASGVVAHAIGYLTPVVSTAHGALSEMAEDGGAVVVEAEGPSVAPALSRAATELIDDSDALERLATELRALRDERSPRKVVEGFVEVWSR